MYTGEAEKRTRPFDGSGFYALIYQITGCGHLDGTDVHEASACALAVEKAGYKPQFYSFDKVNNDFFSYLSA